MLTRNGVLPSLRVNIVKNIVINTRIRKQHRQGETLDMPNGLRCSLASVALRGLNGSALDGHAGMPTGGIGGAGGGSGVVGADDII